MNESSSATVVAIAPEQRGSMNFWSVSAIGIGSMVGAGIFALLGQAALVAKQEVYLAFILGGIVAMLSGYSYARLAGRYPSAGGINEYYRQAFGKGLLAGTLSIIYYITLLVASAMIAKSFGHYAARSIGVDDHGGFVVNLFSSGIVVLLAFVNMISSGTVGKMETLMVGIKMTILALLVAVGVKTLDPLRLEAHDHIGPQSLLASVGLVFFAYAGYGMMANAAGALKNPRRTIPRAMFFAILLVTALYVTLSFVVLANVTPAQLAKFADTAVAQAAEPVLGHAGFLLVSAAALLATASAINANFFSGLQIATGLAEHGQLPRMFRDAWWGKGTKGFVLSIVIVLLLTNLLDLSAVANVASATFLLVYLAVHAAHWKLASETGGSRALILLGLLSMAVVFIAFAVSIARSQPVALLMIAIFVALAAAMEAWVLRHPQAPNDALDPPAPAAHEAPTPHVP